MIVQVTKPSPPSIELHTMGLQGPAGPPGPAGDPALVVPQPVKAITQAAYTVVEANDAWHFIVCNTPVATEIMLPDTGITVGVHFDFIRRGVGDLSFYVPTGTLNDQAANTRVKVRANYSAVSAMLVVAAGNQWVLIGDLA